MTLYTDAKITLSQNVSVEQGAEMAPMLLAAARRRVRATQRLSQAEYDALDDRCREVWDTAVQMDRADCFASLALALGNTDAVKHFLGIVDPQAADHAKVKGVMDQLLAAHGVKNVVAARYIQSASPDDNERIDDE